MTKIIELILNGEIDKVNILLRNSPQICNEEYKNVTIHGETALHLAVLNGNKELIQNLLNTNFYSVNTCNFRGTSPLYYAALKNNMEICELFLEYGANPNDFSGFSEKYPCDITTDEKLKKILEDRKNKISVAINSKEVIQTLYRMRKWGEDTITYMIHKDTPGRVNWPEPYILRGDFENGYKNDYKNGMISQLKNEWKIFNKIIDEYHNGNFNEKICAFCAIYNKTNMKCSKCKKVYFCEKKCQLYCHPYHKTKCVKLT